MNKNNGKIWRIIQIAVVLFLAAISAVYAYGKLNGRFVAVETQAKKVVENEKAIVGLQKDVEYTRQDVEYIRQAVDRIEEKIDR